jgi:hypothetical protein
MCIAVILCHVLMLFIPVLVCCMALQLPFEKWIVTVKWGEGKK